MSRRIGRVRCGNCERVLDDPDGGRQPTRGELRELEGLTGLAYGRRWYQVTRRADADTVLTYVGADGLYVHRYHCPGCHISYQPERLDSRLLEAKHRGEDLVLLVGDRFKVER